MVALFVCIVSSQSFAEDSNKLLFGGKDVCIEYMHFSH